MLYSVLDLTQLWGLYLVLDVTQLNVDHMSQTLKRVTHLLICYFGHQIIDVIVVWV